MAVSDLIYINGPVVIKTNTPSNCRMQIGHTISESVCLCVPMCLACTDSTVVLVMATDQLSKQPNQITPLRPFQLIIHHLFDH